MNSKAIPQQPHIIDKHNVKSVDIYQRFFFKYLDETFDDKFWDQLHAQGIERKGQSEVEILGK